MNRWADTSGTAETVRTFRKEYEECLAEAAATEISSAKAQWLLFAEEWLKLALAAEKQSQREAPIGPVAAE